MFAKVKEEFEVSDAVLLDLHGRVIHELRVDPEGRRLDLDKHQGDPPALIRTVIHAEDKRFYQHGGVDWQAVGAAAVNRRTGPKGPRSKHDHYAAAGGRGRRAIRGRTPAGHSGEAVDAGTAW